MATPTGILFDEPYNKPLSVAGTPQPLCYRKFFLTGTTTLAAVYQDGLLAVPYSQNPTPITSDSAGRFNPIYLDPTIIYRAQLFNVLNQLQEDVDPYVPQNSNVSGTFTFTGTGFVGNPTTLATYMILFGRIVVMHINGISGTSNATTFALNGLPTILIPSFVSQTWVVKATDNGVATDTNSLILDNAGNMSYAKNAAISGWTPSGSKGSGNSNIVYLLN